MIIQKESLKLFLIVFILLTVIVIVNNRYQGARIEEKVDPLKNILERHEQGKKEAPKYYIAGLYDDDQVEIRNAEIGVRTFIGCVEFGSGGEIGKRRIDMRADCEILTSEDDTDGISGADKCRERYYDAPHPGTAWLVVPDGENFIWKRIDHLLRFQNEADNYWLTKDNGLEDLYMRRYNLCIGEKL